MELGAGYRDTFMKFGAIGVMNNIEIKIIPEAF